MKKVLKIGIVVPTYNEAANIPLLLEALKNKTSTIDKVHFIVVVVDDNSPDGTSNIAKQTGKELHRPSLTVKVIDRTIKDGYGKACVRGMEYLLSDGADFIMSMDADLSHDPKYIKDFVKAASKNDFIVGSRYMSGGYTPDWSLIRRLVSRYGNNYARVFLGSKITDYTGGFNMYSKSLLKKIDLGGISSTGYGFLIELKYKALLHAESVYQIPIIFHDRQHGKSKIPKDTIIKNLLLVPKLRYSKD